mgnify:CR=1 FL=1
MDFYKLFYFLTIGDKLSTLFSVVGWISFSLFVICTLVTLFGGTYDKEEDNLKIYWYLNLKRLQTFSMITFPIFLSLWVATPSKKEAVLIIGGGYVGNFITSDSSAKNIPSDIVYFLRSNLQLAAKEAQVEIKNLTDKDTLVDKSKEELIQLIKNKEK